MMVNLANMKVGSLFTCPQNGYLLKFTMQQISRVHTTGPVNMAVYDGSNKLIAVTKEEQVGIVSTTVEFVFHVDVPLVQGNVYTFAIMSSDDLNLATETGSRVVNNNQYTSGFSDPFGAVTVQDGGIVVGATLGVIDQSIIPVDPSVISYVPVTGGENMVSKTFSGQLSAIDAGAKISGVVVKIAVTGGVTDNLIATTDANGNYSVTKDYPVTQTLQCNATANVDADSSNASVSSLLVPFQILFALLKRALTLVVS